MGRRLGLSLLALGTGVALLVSAAFAGPNGDSRRGGTLRVMCGAEPDCSTPPSPPATSVRGRCCTRPARSCSTPFPTRRRAGRASFPRSCGATSVSGDGRTYTFELKRTFRFHNRVPVTARSFADAFNRTASPKMNSAGWRRGFLQGDHRSGRRHAEGRRGSISGVQVLGRYRLRIRLERRAGDFVARLTMPFFCPILPGTPISPAGMDDPPGSGPYYIADRVRNRRMVLERNPYYGGGRTANPDRIVWTIETDAAERIRATERDENDFHRCSPTRTRSSGTSRSRYGLNRPGGQFLRLPTLTNFIFAFNHRSARVQGRRPGPAQEGDQLRPRQAGPDPCARLPGGRRTDRLLPAALSESRRRLPDRRAGSRHGAKVARAREATAEDAHPLHGELPVQRRERPCVQLEPEAARHRGRCEVLRLHHLAREARDEGEPWDVAWLTWGAFYADPAGAFLPLLRDTRYEARIKAANRVTGAAPSQVVGRTSRRTSCATTRPSRRTPTSPPLILVSRSFGCFGWLQGYELDLAAACKK